MAFSREKEIKLTIQLVYAGNIRADLVLVTLTLIAIKASLALQDLVTMHSQQFYIM